MSIKQLSAITLVSLIAISPLFIKAEKPENEVENPNKNIVQGKIKNDDNKGPEDKEDKKGSTSPRVATSTKNDDQSGTSTRERERINETKTRTIQAATNIAKKITREIARVRNIIDRLTNNDSIVAKLDAQGINTTNIKAKLDSAKILINNAEIDIQTAKGIIASTATSSDPSIKTKVIGVRKLFEQASSNLKSAIVKIKEANKLIREIPGVRKIEKGETATSTATTTNSN